LAQVQQVTCNLLAEMVTIQFLAHTLQQAVAVVQRATLILETMVVQAVVRGLAQLNLVQAQAVKVTMVDKVLHLLIMAVVVVVVQAQ
jgi:hypothetical protein